MNWKKTTFERQKLFVEVWASPISKLAKEYGLSDVGLRKICVALDVPLPPRGYWQKLAAGKTIVKPPLHETTVATSYARTTYTAPVDEVLEERVMHARDALSTNVQEDTQGYVPPLSPRAFSPQAQLVMRALNGTKPREGALSAIGVTWVDISTSENLRERALLLVDRFAHELDRVGARFENSHPPLSPLRHGARRESGSTRNCFILHGQRFFVHIRERIAHELVPPPPQKPQKRLRGAARPTWEYRPEEYRYIPTGKVYASIVDATTQYERYKIEDTARGIIETKIRKVVRSAAEAALRRTIESEVRAERELARRNKAQEWETAKAKKDELLTALARYEKLANDLDRARSLRRLIDEIAVSRTAPAELVDSVELMTLMADWLDPLVNAAWAEVDAIGEKNPYGSPW